MKISYAITVCNEFVEIQRLVAYLLKHKRSTDNIVILFDSKNGDPEVEAFLRSHSINGEFAWHKSEFNGHFADWKNYLTTLCSGDYIFQIDADELPNDSLIEHLPTILTANNGVDMIWVPRVNTVTDLTVEHVKKWGWQVNTHGWVNWPDWQGRIYKNHPSIQWENKVHESLVGIKTYAQLPESETFALAHPKTIERQEKQNNYYDTL
jgi:glycosyltransferase involved in cell wall biosynthesis